MEFRKKMVAITDQNRSPTTVPAENQDIRQPVAPPLQPLEDLLEVSNVYGFTFRQMIKA